ncbi:LysR family transcriptional regulator [Lysinibacillus sp. LZ02]|uniref:LysR family transcriptional regulator n=1 Tax=Lysinibacillus sp. LZ02 TaxID=3420668 RepID=UPI003D35AF7E
MNLDRIQYVLEVAQCGSITIAASNLHITQSALSQAITGIEEELGNKIFNRSRKGIEVTAFGQKIIEKAKTLMLTYQELLTEASIWKDELHGELKIATIPGTMHLLIKVLMLLKKTHPRIQIKITEKVSQEIIKDLLQNQCDIGLINVYGETVNHPDLHFEALLHGRMQAAFSKNSALAKNDMVTTQDILNQKLVIYDDETINWFIKNFEAKYGDLQILFRTNNTDALRIAIKNEMGITLALDYSLTYEPTIVNGENLSRYIHKLDQTFVKFGLVQQKKHIHLPISQIFLHQFTTELQNSKH